MIVAILAARGFVGFAGASKPLPAAHNLLHVKGEIALMKYINTHLCLESNPWYRFTIVAQAMTAPTAAQYTFCRNDELGTPSPIDISPMSLMRLFKGSILLNCEPDDLQEMLINMWKADAKQCTT